MKQGKVIWFDSLKGIGEAMLISGEVVFLNCKFCDSGDHIPVIDDVVLGQVKIGDNNNMYLSPWEVFDAYVFEIMSRTDWDKKEVQRVLKGLKDKTFAPADEQYYLKRISPF